MFGMFEKVFIRDVRTARAELAPSSLHVREKLAPSSRRAHDELSQTTWSIDEASLPLTLSCCT